MRRGWSGVRRGWRIRGDHRLFAIIAGIVIAAQIREQKRPYVLQVKGNRDITSPTIAPVRSFWGARSSSTGGSRTASGGFWMWRSAKTHAASAGPQRFCQPPRRPPPGRQPTTAGEDEQTRREEQAPAMRPRPRVPPDGPRQCQILMRRPCGPSPPKTIAFLRHYRV